MKWIVILLSDKLHNLTYSQSIKNKGICDSSLHKWRAIYLHSVLIPSTDVSYTENKAYNIVDHAKKFPCDGAGTSGDEEQTKKVYEEIYIWCFLNTLSNEEASV